MVLWKLLFDNALNKIHRLVFLLSEWNGAGATIKSRLCRKQIQKLQCVADVVSFLKGEFLYRVPMSSRRKKRGDKLRYFHHVVDDVIQRWEQLDCDTTCGSRSSIQLLQSWQLILQCWWWGALDAFVHLVNCMNGTIAKTRIMFFHGPSWRSSLAIHERCVGKWWATLKNMMILNLAVMLMS